MSNDNTPILAGDSVAVVLGALGKINELLGIRLACATCGNELVDSVSGAFCSEPCQAEWHAQQAPLDQPTGPVTPNVDVPDAPPVRPMTWLDPNAPKALARPGHAVLDEVTAFVRRFSAFPSEHCAPTLALWYAHTHIADRLYVTPRLILDSAEPGSGKTRVLEVAQYLVAAPEMTVSASRAALFRLVADGPITILFDEVDTIFNAKTGGGNEDLRAMLNAGYKRSATIPRYDAKTRTVRRFPVYTPAALAGIARGMPATITTRAITIHMRRRRADEHVEPFRERAVERQSEPIRAALAEWMDAVTDRVVNTEPTMPEGVTDRSAEIWEPLLAIADAAGGHWPETARNACGYFVLTNVPLGSLGTQLLSDVRDIFTAAKTDRIATKEILANLLTLADSPWADLPDRPLNARQLSRELRRYGVSPVTFDAKVGKAKGYVTFQTSGMQAQVGLGDAWSRYLTDDGNAETSGNHPVPEVTESAPVIQSESYRSIPGITDE